MHLVASVCVSLSVCPVQAATFESLDLETSFLVQKYISSIYMPVFNIRVIGSRPRSRSREQKGRASVIKYICGWSASVERQGCLNIVFCCYIVLCK